MNRVTAWQRRKMDVYFHRANNKPVYRTEDVEKTLWVKTEFYSASATWRRGDGVWTCVRADQALRWMLKTERHLASRCRLRSWSAVMKRKGP